MSTPAQGGGKGTDSVARLFGTEPYFSIKEHGILRAGGTLAQMLESNRDDADMCDWLKRAKPGDVLHAGGGAAPRVEVRRVL